jgi:uncharacterized lipoprotein NlpE involved in copper resistance
MNVAFKSSVILFFVLLIVVGCRNRAEDPNRPGNESAQPQEKPRDSSNFYTVPDTVVPEHNPPGRAKEQSRAELDTLLPIKA